DRSRFALCLFVCICAAGLLSHVLFVFVLLGQGLALLVFERGEWRRFVSAAAAATVPFLALWARQFAGQMHNGATDWMPHLHPATVLRAPLEFYGRVPTILLFVFTAVFLAAARTEQWRTLPRRGIALLATASTAGLLAPLLVSAVRPVYFPGRHSIIALLPLVAVLGAVLAATVPRPLLILLCLVLAVSQIWVQFENRELMPEARRLPAGQSDRTTASFLLKQASPGDAVVFTGLTRAAADYYFRRSSAQGRFVEISFPAENATHLGWCNPSVPAERRVELGKEASDAVGALREAVAQGHKVWVYVSTATEVDQLLRREIDAALPLRALHSLEGAFHTAILEYGSP
ncbi:MAG TPA: hypothetical protein VLH09_06345, partial [Bryobacteraceae bacterium]|nr:hypothetical protein [Bryobacteraceae bacterium]